MQLTAEQINDFVGKAVMESQIGEAVKTSVARVMADLSKSYNNPFDEVIKRHVTQIIDQEVLTSYRPIMEENIKAALQRHMTDEFVNKIVDAGLERLRNRY